MEWIKLNEEQLEIVADAWHETFGFNKETAKILLGSKIKFNIFQYAVEHPELLLNEN